MTLEVRRLDRDGRYQTTIERADGVRFAVQGVAHTFAIPHDLAHYVVEQALGIEIGFWGNVAAGAVFPTMRYLDGRRKPKAAEKSKALLKTNARALVEAEVIVRIFSDTIEQRHEPTSAVLAGRLRDRMHTTERSADPIGASEIANVYSAYRSLRDAWERLPVDGILTQLW